MLSYPRILHFRLPYCSPSLRSDTQRLYSVLYHTHSTKVFHVFNQSLRSRIISVVSLFLSTCVLPPQHPFFASLIVVLALLDTTPNSFIALVIAGCCMFKDILRRLFAICTPSERCSIAIDVPELGNREGARVVLEYEGGTGS